MGLVERLTLNFSWKRFPGMYMEWAYEFNGHLAKAVPPKYLEEQSLKEVVAIKKEDKLIV